MVGIWSEHVEVTINTNTHFFLLTSNHINPTYFDDVHSKNIYIY